MESEIKNLELSPVNDFNEIPGKGVTGVVDNKSVKVQKSDNDLISDLSLMIDDKEYLVTLVEDKTLNKDVIKSLSNDYEIEILSGDKTEKVKKIGEDLNLSLIHI